MKYFTKKWCLGELEDWELNKIMDNYHQYIEEIYPKLPVTLKLMVRSISLHDGFITSAKFLENEEALQIDGVFGDLSFGYFNLRIKYYNIIKINKNILKQLFENTKLEVLSDEVKILASEQYSHRIVFSTGKEIEVIFKNLLLEIGNEVSENFRNNRCTLKII